MQRSYSRLYYAASADEDVAGLSHAAFRLWTMSQARACAKGTAGVINTRAAATVARWSQLEKAEVPAAIAELVFGGFWVATSDTARDANGEPVEYLIRNFQKFQVTPVIEEGTEPVSSVEEVVTMGDLRRKLYALLDAEAASNPEGRVSYAAVIKKAVPAAVRKYGKHEDGCECGIPTCKSGLKGLQAGANLYSTVVAHAADQYFRRLEFDSDEFYARQSQLLRLMGKHNSHLELIDAMDEAAARGITDAGRTGIPGGYIRTILKGN